MNRKKVIYIGIILILTVILSITYFSYAFFTRQDIQSGKLNIVTGTLTYKITSSDLNSNNSITLSANEKKKINIKLISLNDINSKYILYYQTTNSNFNIGYSSTTVDATSGTINANSTKNITISIQNNNSSNITLIFGVIGGFVSNNLALSNGTAINTQYDYSTCNYNINYVWDFPFDPDGDGNGQMQNFTVPCDGNYKLEVWGAKGQTPYGYGSVGEAGNGGYAAGDVRLISSSILYIAVGNTTGYNGGGCGIYNSCGGGATHIASVSGLLKDISVSDRSKIFIVAGAGGGGGITSGSGWTSASGGAGGAGGGTTGIDGSDSLGGGYGSCYGGTGGSQTSGGVATNCTSPHGCQNPTLDKNGSFGQGGAGYNAYGGGGYYGGGGGATGWYNFPYQGRTSGGYGCGSGGGGGSSYIGGVSNGITISGNSSMPNPSGSGQIIGNNGNGFARITYIG